MKFLWLDLRSGWLQLLRQPVVSAAAVISLAVALGAGTLLFGLLDSLLLTPVSGVPASERLVEIGRTSQGHGFDSLSLPNLRSLQGETQSMTALYGQSGMTLNMAGPQGPERVSGRLVSGNYFSAMSVAPYSGRLLQPGDDRSGRPARVAVVGYGAYKRLFGANPARIGTTVRLNGIELVLVGVAPPAFDHPGLGERTDFYVPLELAAVLGRIPAAEMDHRGARWVFAGGRLAVDATLEQANAELEALGAQLRASWPRLNREIGYRAAPMRALPPPARMPVGIFIGVLFALVGIVLLVATSNVASLLLARGEARRREIAMRFVLGAKRGRVLRQMLVETGVLVVPAALAGVLLAIAGWRLLGAIEIPFPVSLDFGLSFSPLVWCFLIGLVFLTTLLAGLMPALRTTRMAPGRVFASSGSSVAGGSSRFRVLLATSQVVFSLVLLVMAGLFVNAVQRAGFVDPGYRVDGIYTAGLDMRPTGLRESQRVNLVERYLSALDQDVLFDSVAAASVVPLSFSRQGYGGFLVDDEGVVDADVNVVAGAFFKTLDIPIRGRVFDSRDTAGSERVAIINSTLARRLSPEGEVLGRTFNYGGPAQNEPVRIVGITPDGRYSRLSETGQPFMYLPHVQQPQRDMFLFMRTGQDLATVTQRLRAIQQDIAPRLLAPRIKPLAEVARAALLPQKIAGGLAGILGVLGAGLTAVGLYGMLSHLIASHRREIGVRLALGASPTRIRRRLVWLGARPVFWGACVGLLAAAGLAAALDGFLFGIEGADGAAFGSAVAILGLVGILAVSTPASRAARISPAEVLRDE